MTCGLVHARYSLPEWQAVKLTFFALYFVLGKGVVVVPANIHTPPWLLLGDLYPPPPSPTTYTTTPPPTYLESPVLLHTLL